MVKISLDNYATIFGVTPTGIVRYLRLVTPVDREKQMAYTFTVLPCPTFFFLFKRLLDVLFCVQLMSWVDPIDVPVGKKRMWHLQYKAKVFLEVWK